MIISQKAFDLITSFEGCSLAPDWPGGASGITYGFGYDCGYNLHDQIQRDWGSYVNGNVLAFMMSCSGRTGLLGKSMITPATKILRITQQAADEVFNNKTLPRFKKLAFDTYPGLENLPEDAQGAIVTWLS